MKMKYSIGLLVFSIMVICLACVFYNAQDTDIKESNYESAYVNEQNPKEDGFYLCEKNGYIVILLSDKKTLYEYTDIKYDLLPENIRQEVSKGKYLEGVEELYGFLENYSS